MKIQLSYENKEKQTNKENKFETDYAFPGWFL